MIAGIKKTILSFLLINFITISTSVVNATDISEDWIEMKCHVYTKGDFEAIQYSKIQKQHLNLLTKYILQQTTVPILAVKPLPITRVGECVEKSAEFSTAKLRELERNTPD